MKRIFPIMLIVAFAVNSYGQLILNNSLTPQQLANAISGPGVTIFNVSYTGDSTMRASFNAAGSNLGINSGILLGTGDVNFVAGANVLTGGGFDMGLPGDSILDSLANLASSNPVITYDASILEFDFMTQSSNISFRYVFASEEYPEFVCSQYNDVFAFFITGPGITGSLNMALIPGTSTPVTINTVNSGVVGSSAGFPPAANCGLGYSNLYVDNFNGPSIEFDGFTVPLTASAIVQPCKVYHLKIMIADAGDGVWDSGVFLEAGSFTSNPVVNAGADQSMCSGNTISIGSPPAANYTYNWSPVTGLSSTTVANPTVTLTNNTANTVHYTYVIIGNNGTCLFTDTVKISVDPAPATTFTITPSQTCAGQPMTVSYTGTAAANYNWDFGNANILSGSGSGPYQISFPNAGTDSVHVVASNPGCSGTATQFVTITPIPLATFSVPPQACMGDTVAISFTGTAGGNANYTWDFGGGQVHSGSGSGPFLTSWTNPGLATISLSVDENGCQSLPEVLQIDIAPIPTSFAGLDTAVCPAQPVYLGSPAIPGYLYQWTPTGGLNDPQAADPTAVILNAGNVAIDQIYTLTVTSSQGCSSSDQVKVTTNPGVLVDFVAPLGQCSNGNSFDFSVSGTYPAGSIFSWDFGSNASISSSNAPAPQNISFTTPGIHTITLNATSANCSMPPVNHTIEIYPEPSFDFIADNLQGCSPLLVNMSLSHDSSYSYSWGIENGAVSSLPTPSFALTTPGQFDVILTGKNSYGCSLTVTKRKYLTVFASPTALFTPSPAVASITTPVITFLNGSLNAQSYLWNFGDSTTSQSVQVSHTYAKTGIYEVTLIAISDGGCVDTIRGMVEINEGFEFFVPNSFSPNGDGVNDFFQGYGINFKNVEMTIYDRWGKKIYETKEHKPWDGRIKDTVQNDVYVYRILVTDKMNEQRAYIGSVTVVK